MLDKFLHDNSTSMRLFRTIVQGILSVLVANTDLITGMFSIDASMKPVLVAIIMAILTPIMSELGKYTTESKTAKSEG